MLGYVAGAALWGYAKASALGARRHQHNIANIGMHALAEELEFRVGLERGVGRAVLGLNSGVARGLSALAFGAVHEGSLARKADAALGGMLYSLAFDRAGLAGAALTHLAHNLGIYLGSR